MNQVRSLWANAMSDSSSASVSSSSPIAIHLVYPFSCTARSLSGGAHGQLEIIHPHNLVCLDAVTTNSRPCGLLGSRRTATALGRTGGEGGSFPIRGKHVVAVLVQRNRAVIPASHLLERGETQVLARKEVSRRERGCHHCCAKVNM